jgi:hypothetical protein
LLIRLSEGREARDVYPTHDRINTARTIESLLWRSRFTADDVIRPSAEACVVPGRVLAQSPDCAATPGATGSEKMTRPLTSS